MRDLLIVVPSRARPGNIARLIEAMNDTCRGDTHLVVGLDSDDPTLEQYLNLLLGPGKPPEYVIESGLRFVVPWINHLAVPRSSDFRFIGHFGDDNVPETVGWDVQVIESLERCHFCFADDEYRGRPAGSLCCHIFMRSEVVRSLGYMGPPSIKHMYVDPVWMAWGEVLGIEFLAEVKLPHLHYSVGKSPHDPTYAASDAQTQDDCRLFNEYCRDPNGLNRDVERIQAGAPVFTPDEYENFRAFHNIPG